MRIHCDTVREAQRLDGLHDRVQWGAYPVIFPGSGPSRLRLVLLKLEEYTLFAGCQTRLLSNIPSGQLSPFLSLTMETGYGDMVWPLPCEQQAPGSDPT